MKRLLLCIIYVLVVIDQFLYGYCDVQQSSVICYMCHGVLVRFLYFSYSIMFNVEHILVYKYHY